MINKKNETVIYTGRRRESSLEVYELDEPVLFFSPPFYSVTSIISAARLPPSSASQLRQTPAVRAER